PPRIEVTAITRPVVTGCCNSWAAIADDVGIGKTVEAGLIAAELLAQGDARGLVVLCSPALAEQWRAELYGKFGVDARP
ncbi:helicase, partial [Streptomyces zinciresistens K42]